MQVMKWSLMALAVSAGTAQIANADPMVSSQSGSNGFVEDSTTSLITRNYYFNRNNLDAGAANQMDWSQALLGNFSSGFTQGTVGVGVDAFAYGVLALDSENAGVGNVLVTDDDGKYSTNTTFGHVGASVKMRLSSTELKYGDLQPTAPVFAAGGSRILPATAQGFQLMSSELQNLDLESGHFTAGTGPTGQGNHEDIGTSYSSATANAVSFAGGKYRLADNLTGSLYAAKFDDIWNQYYTNLNLTLGAVNFDANLYRTLNDGSGVSANNLNVGSINNTAFSLAAAYAVGAQTFTLAYQAVHGNTPFDYVQFGDNDKGNGGGDSILLANSVQYSDFNMPGEKSWQARYDLDMGAFGVPGLSLMARYVYGNGMDGSDIDSSGIYSGLSGVSGSEHETNLEAKYVVQSGAAKDLAIRVRQAWHGGDADTGGQLTDFRVMMEYPISIM